MDRFVRFLGHNLRFRAHTYLGRYPGLVFRLHRLIGRYHELTVKHGTDLLIEGVPRTGTTFCCRAFELAQQREMSLAYHLHLPAHVVRAVAMGVPALVLIRRPKDAASSLVLRNPRLTVKAALERYLDFYGGIARLRDRVVVADFEEVVSDLGGVIERVNRKFSTDFKTFVHSPENLAAVEAMLRKEDAILQADDLMSYWPNRAKAMAKAGVGFAGVEDLLRKCESLYDELSPAAACRNGRSNPSP